MNVTAIGLQAPKWVRAAASAPTSTPAPAPQSKAAPHQAAGNAGSVPALMSSTTQHALLLATQEIGSEESEEHIPPAQQARTGILENPELENRPFGAVVSRFARGETPLLEAPTGSSSDTPPADVEEQEDQAEIAISPPDPNISLDDTLSGLI